MWKSGVNVFAPMLNVDDSTREQHVHQAGRILGDTSLSPGAKERGVEQIDGFGHSTASGLVMVFHPHEFMMWNGPSKEAFKRIGLSFHSLSAFQDNAANLLRQLGADDFFELDRFIHTALDTWLK